VNVYPYSAVVKSFISFINRLKRSVVITGWAVALICYVSNRAKHKKRADFDPLRAKPIKMILIKRSVVDYVRVLLHMTALVGVVLHGWSGQVCYHKPVVVISA